MHHFQYDPIKRRQYQNPEEILNSIGLKPNMVFIDLGCNDGYFTIPAAKIVGVNGIAYGIDSDIEAIKKLQDSAKLLNLNNVETKVGFAEDLTICNDCADIIFLGTVLHDFNDPIKALRNSYEMLKPNGRLINFDWQKKETVMGPPLQKRLNQIEAEDLLTKSGFNIIDYKDISENYYQITAQK